MQANILTAAIIISVSAISFLSVDDYPKEQNAYETHMVSVALIASEGGIQASNECITIASKTLFGGRESVTEEEELRSGDCSRAVVKYYRIGVL